METMDFSGTSDISQLITKPQAAPPSEILIEEKKLEEYQMMEFTSSIDDLVGPEPPMQSDSVYTNVTSGRVTGLAPGDSAPAKKSKASNPFGLSDEQYIAVIAGIVAALSTSSMVQSRIASMVPNPQGMNGTLATAVVAAVLFFFAMRFLKK
jgi:hypothetical protein